MASSSTTTTKVLLRITMLSVVALGMWQLITAPFLDIETIEVRGHVESLGLQEVTQAVRDSVNGNVLTTNIEAVKKSVESISWVKRAQVTRLWPDALHISVVRHKAVAIWDDGRLVSETGELFASNDEPIERLAKMPTFGGDPQHVPEAVKNLPLFDQEVQKIGARIKAIYVTFRGSWSVVMDSERFSSVTVELGRALSANGPLLRLSQVVENFDRVCAMMQGYPDRIDARYRNAFAARLPDAQGRDFWIQDQVAKGLMVMPAPEPAPKSTAKSTSKKNTRKKQ